MTEIEKELIAQQAEMMGFPDTAQSVRLYCWTPRTRSALLRLSTFAAAFGWHRIPGWRLIAPSLPRFSRAPRMTPWTEEVRRARGPHAVQTSPAPKKLPPAGASDSPDREAAGGGAGDSIDQDGEARSGGARPQGSDDVTDRISAESASR